MRRLELSGGGFAFFPGVPILQNTCVTRMCRLFGLHHALLILAALVLSGCEVGTEARPPAAAVSTSSAEWEGTSPTAAFGASERVARGDLEFVEGYQRGYQLALEEGKPMLVFFTAEWCHFCHQMAQDAFTNEQVVNLSRRFVCILVDADAEPDVCREFRVQGFPTVQFLSPRGVPLNRVVGKKPGHQMLMAMQAALQGVARREPAEGPLRR